MESQLKVSFFLFHAKKTKTRQTPIYMRLRYNYDAVTIATGYTIAAASWNKKAMRVIGNTNEIKSVNDGLKALEVKVRNAVNQKLLVGRPFSVNNIKDDVLGISKNAYSVQDAFDAYLGMIKSLIGKEYSPITYGKYRQTYDRVMEFAKLKYNRSNFYLFDLNDNFMEDFGNFLRIDIGNGQTTIYKHWQRLSRVIRYAIKRKMLDIFPFVDYTIKLPKKPVEYLTQEEVNRIDNKDFGTERLNTIRDFFLFSIYSGLAYTEMSNLREEHLVTGIDGEVWVDMYRQKTKKQYKVPLLPKAIEILNKYKDIPLRKKKGILLPITSNQKMNAYLKEIQAICKIFGRI